MIHKVLSNSDASNAVRYATGANEVRKREWTRRGLPRWEKWMDEGVGASSIGVNTTNTASV